MKPGLLRRRWTATIVALTMLVAGVQAQGQSGAASALNPVCGSGQDKDAGCDAIRARTIVDATTAPWRGIGRVNFASIQIRTHCTGTLVADRIVLTAAHCLFNEARKSWIPAQSIQFVAGYQRGDHIAASTVQRYVLPPGQDASGRALSTDITDDWALLALDDPIGGEVGIMSTGNRDDADVVMAGYPQLRPHVLSIAHDCGTARKQDQLIITNCAVMQGDSGGPLLNDEATIIGVTAQARGDGRILYMIAVPAQHWEPALQKLKQEIDAQ